MNEQDDWYHNITAEINKHRFSKKFYNKYKLEQLTRIAKRISDFSPDCSHCQDQKEEIEKLIGFLSGLDKSPKTAQKIYFNDIDNIVKHLKEKHGLISEGQNIALWLPIGICFGSLGIVFGNIFDNIGIGLSLGMGIGLSMGVAIGASLDAKAKKEGTVI